MVRTRQASIWLGDRLDGSPHTLHEVEEELQRLMDTGVNRASGPQVRTVTHLRSNSQQVQAVTHLTSNSQQVQAISHLRSNSQQVQVVTHLRYKSHQVQAVSHLRANRYRQTPSSS